MDPNQIEQHLYQLVTEAEEQQKATAKLLEGIAKEREALHKQLASLPQTIQNNIQTAVKEQVSAAHSEITQSASHTVREMKEASQRQDLTHYILAIGLGILAALLTNVAWQWFKSPPTIENNLSVDIEKLLQGLKNEQEFLLGPPQDRGDNANSKTKPKTKP